MTRLSYPVLSFLSDKPLQDSAARGPFIFQKDSTYAIELTSRTSIRMFLRAAKCIMLVKVTTLNIKDVELELYVRFRD
jgi:hypothetical protein